MTSSDSPLLAAASLGLWAFPALAGLICHLGLISAQVAGFGGVTMALVLVALALSAESGPGPGV